MPASGCVRVLIAVSGSRMQQQPGLRFRARGLGFRVRPHDAAATQQLCWSSGAVAILKIENAARRRCGCVWFIGDEERGQLVRLVSACESCEI